MMIAWSTNNANNLFMFTNFYINKIIYKNYTLYIFTYIYIYIYIKFIAHTIYL